MTLDRLFSDVQGFLISDQWSAIFNIVQRCLKVTSVLSSHTLVVYVPSVGFILKAEVLPVLNSVVPVNCPVSAHADGIKSTCAASSRWSDCSEIFRVRGWEGGKVINVNVGRVVIDEKGLFIINTPNFKRFNQIVTHDGSGVHSHYSMFSMCRTTTLLVWHYCSINIFKWLNEITLAYMYSFSVINGYTHPVLDKVLVEGVAGFRWCKLVHTTRLGTVLRCNPPPPHSGTICTVPLLVCLGQSSLSSWEMLG